MPSLPRCPPMASAKHTDRNQQRPAEMRKGVVGMEESAMSWAEAMLRTRLSGRFHRAAGAGRSPHCGTPGVHSPPMYASDVHLGVGHESSSGGYPGVRPRARSSFLRPRWW